MIYTLLPVFDRIAAIENFFRGSNLVKGQRLLSHVADVKQIVADDAVLVRAKCVSQVKDDAVYVVESESGRTRLAGISHIGTDREYLAAALRAASKISEKRQRLSEVLQPLLGEEPDESATVPSEPQVPFNHKDVALPSDSWGKHVFGGVPLKVAYSVCSPGPDMGLLCAEKLVLFTVTDDSVAHEVFVRGVKLDLDEPGGPASVLKAVDGMHVCSGAGFLEEFPFASSNSNLTVWNGSLYNKKCAGTSLERCVACKYLRRILTNQMCRRKKNQVKNKCFSKDENENASCAALEG
ncbi:hypothetical protein HPB51_002215 [Rhipicephalus microplus]|uniref:Uncharacterized protein n=1 Tax=Rhipicephalus microplus TaxID=6941 RepID=A0A9J6EFB8_RHIMP|nr:hypothetical protein HPB51_002215 [Rhipicephalus microplus]